MIGRWPPPLVRTLISATNGSRCLLSSVGAGSAGTVGTGRLERHGWNGTIRPPTKGFLSVTSGQFGAKWPVDNRRATYTSMR